MSLKCKWCFPFVCILVIFIGSGCEKSRDVSIHISEKDGIRWIQNSENPIEDGIIKIDFKEVFRLGDEDIENEIFQWITDINIDKNRTLYICEMKQPLVRQYDTNGSFIRQIGRKGQGPGEYERPDRLIFDEKHHAIVFDFVKHKLIRYHENGEFSDEILITPIFKERLNYPNWLSSNRLLGLVNNTKKDKMNYYFHIIDLEKGASKEIFSFTVLQDIIFGQGGSIISRERWKFHVEISDVEEIFVVKDRTYDIDVYNVKGEPVRIISRKYRPVPLTEEEKEKSASKGPQTGDGLHLPVPDFHQDIQGIVFPGNSECWVITSTKIDDHHLIDVFDKEGRFLRQMLPNIPLTVSKSSYNSQMKWKLDKKTRELYLYQVEIDKDYVEQVVCYRALLPEST